MTARAIFVARRHLARRIRSYSTAPNATSSILLSRNNLVTSFALGLATAGAWYAYDVSTLPAKKAEHAALYGPTLTWEDKAILQDPSVAKRIERGADEASPRRRSVDLPAAGTDDVVDPQTQIAFPSTISPKSLGTSLREPLRLIGLGVRTVSFLSVRVYSAGFYAEPSALRGLKELAGWEGDVAKAQLLAKATALPATKGVTPDAAGGEALFRALLASPSHFALRIVPTRGTDFAHLRDGFYRSVVARMKVASAAGQLSEEESERVAASLTTLKSFFPSGTSVPKNHFLVLTKTPSNSLVIEYDGRTLGELRDPFVARELLLAYFADKAPISERLKTSVAEGFEKILRPQDVQS